MLSSFVIRMLSLSFVCICVVIMPIFVFISILCLIIVVSIYGLDYEWIRSRFVYSFAHTHMHFQDINSMSEFRPFRRKCWLRFREIVISTMASQIFSEFMGLITSWGDNLRTVIRKCSHSYRTLSIACKWIRIGVPY